MKSKAQWEVVKSHCILAVMGTCGCKTFGGLWLLGWGARVRFSSTGSRLDNVARRLGPWSSGGSGVGRVSLNPSRLFALHEVLLFCGGSRQNQD